MGRIKGVCRPCDRNVILLMIGQDEDDTDEDASHGNSEDEVLREELELREAIRKSLSEIVVTSSVNGNPNDAASILHNLDEIEVISEEDIDDLRGEV